jgi:hypothetical protein
MVEFVVIKVCRVEFVVIKAFHGVSVLSLEAVSSELVVNRVSQGGICCH